nr:hypothetical protein [Anaerolineae bacterium]
MQRRTQTPKYWGEDFQLVDADIEHLYNVLLEREIPLSADEMALVLVRYRVDQEEQQIQLRGRSGDQFRLRREYDTGDEIAFPQLHDESGVVVAVREGQNPQYGKFGVITVEVDSGRMHEFACGLDIDHPLNVEDETPEDEGLLSPEELFIEYGGNVAATLEERFEEHGDLVRLAGRWFPRSLLAEINIGHLNLAEAVLDMNDGGPLSTPDLLGAIGMLDDINSRLAEFSMNYGLQEDPRFDEVGPAGQVMWYLVRMEPEEVRMTPPRLVYDLLPEDPNLLDNEMRELELAIRDEHTDIVLKRAPAPESVTITLTYPHKRAGTLPLSHELRRMFPTAYRAPRIRFTLVDDESGEELPAWVVRQGGYVYGLEAWFERYDIPVGGYITVERTDTAGYVRIKYTKRSPRKDWVLTGVVDGDRLRFENQQWSIGCDYDDLMVIVVPDEEAVEARWQETRKRKIPLSTIMTTIGRELAALNPQKNIHAKTLYSAVNLILRSPPGPIFSHLVALPEFEPIGGHYWRLKDIKS